MHRKLPKSEPLNGQYLLVHGLADDNVHPQSGLLIDETLQGLASAVPYRTRFYSNENHGLGGVSRDLYALLTGFLVDDATVCQAI